MSVVIPVRDRSSGLATTLAAVARSAPLDPTEVVVVDDASVDPAGTAEAATATGATIVGRRARGGPAAARNTGWRTASGEIVMFVDADCVPDPEWLATLVAHFDDGSLAAVAPRVPARAPERDPAPSPLSTWLDRYDQARSPLDLGTAASPVRPGSRVPYVPSAALAVRRQALDQVGGFDEAMIVGEDVDLIWRLVAAGWRVRYEPAARVGHPSRPAIGSWLRQRRDYGASAAPLAARHGSLVAPVALPWPSALAWGVAVAGPPVASGVAAAGALAWSTRRLAGVASLPAGEAARVGVTGHLLAGRALAEALRRSWWPLTLVAAALLPRRRRGRLGVALAAPLVVEWQRAGRPLRALQWCALRVADDVSYGTGVWAGAWKARSARALLPRLVR